MHCDLCCQAVVQLPCEHLFHRACLLDNADQSSKCPNCRVRFSLRTGLQTVLAPQLSNHQLQGSQHTTEQESFTTSHKITELIATWRRLEGTQLQEQMCGWRFWGDKRQAGSDVGHIERKVQDPSDNEIIRSLAYLEQKLEGHSDNVQNNFQQQTLGRAAVCKPQKAIMNTQAKLQAKRSGIDLSQWVTGKNKSGYVGVYTDRSGRHQASIHMDGKKIYLGAYSHNEDAATTEAEEYQRIGRGPQQNNESRHHRTRDAGASITNEAGLVLERSQRNKTGYIGVYEHSSETKTSFEARNDDKSLGSSFASAEEAAAAIQACRDRLQLTPTTFNLISSNSSPVAVVETLAPDISQFLSVCWDCKKGKWSHKHFSRTQCRILHGHTEVDWRDYVPPKPTKQVANDDGEYSCDYCGRKLANAGAKTNHEKACAMSSKFVSRDSPPGKTLVVPQGGGACTYCERRARLADHWPSMVGEEGAARVW